MLLAFASGCDSKEASSRGAGGSGAQGGKDGGQGGAAGAGGMACPTFAQAETKGHLENLEITEASGIAASRRNPGVLWLHNDSGDGPRVFATNGAGKHLGTFTLGGVQAVDWEDIAVGPGPVAGASYVYVGDFGDNLATRANIRIHRFVEPDVDEAAAAADVTVSDVESFTLQYEDGPRNAETLWVDPINADVVIVSKEDSGPSHVYRVAALAAGAGSLTLKRIASLPFGTEPLTGSNLTTGGDISPSGRWLAVRSYTHAFIWRRAVGQDLASALAGEPCPVPLLLQPQGEAFGFTHDESGYYTVSEGNGSPLHYYAAE